MTYFLWLLAGLALGAAGVWLRRTRPRTGAALAVVGAGAAIGAVGWQVRSSLFTAAPPALDRYSATVAYFMGQAVLDELRSFEGAVYMLLPPDRGHNARALDSLFNTFARVLAPVAGLRVQDIVVHASEREIQEGRVSLAAFDQALSRATGAVACVSFVGWPREAVKAPPVPAPSPPLLFVFDPAGGTAWQPSLRHGAIRRVIVARPDAVREQEGPLHGPPDELFQRFFLMVRPQDADRVARELGREL